MMISLMLATCLQTTDAGFEMTFATKAEAQTLLTTPDDFTKAWSAFDIDSRMGKAGSTRAELMDHITAQALEWSEDDKSKINASIARIKTQLTKQNINLTLKEAVTLVKTTAKEEGGAMGYTRGNYIVLAENFHQMGDEDLDKILVHELFHVISRSNPSLRSKLYEIIGFSMMPEVSYPTALLPYRITNPDATQTDSYITLKVSEEEVPCIMILYSKGNYEGGSFFQYLNIGFLKLEAKTKQTVLNEEGPVIYGMQEVENFFEQVGKNTQYIIHPEEIMADNFAFAVLGKEGMTDQAIIEKIRKVLKAEAGTH